MGKQTRKLPKNWRKIYPHHYVTVEKEEVDSDINQFFQNEPEIVYKRFKSRKIKTSDIKRVVRREEHLVIDELRNLRVAYDIEFKTNKPKQRMTFSKNM